MNRFDKWFIRKVKWSWDNFKRLEEENMMKAQAQANMSGYQTTGTLSKASNGPNIRSNNSFNFKIHKATGGYVIEHDRYSDSPIVDYDNAKQLTVVTDPSELGKMIQEIMLMEVLKR